MEAFEFGRPFPGGDKGGLRAHWGDLLGLLQVFILCHEAFFEEYSSLKSAIWGRKSGSGTCSSSHSPFTDGVKDTIHLSWEDGQDFERSRFSLAHSLLVSPLRVYDDVEYIEGKRRMSLSASRYEQFAHFLRSWADVPDAEIAKAIKIFQPVSVPKGGFLLRAGDVPDTLGFVVSGVMRSFFITSDGNEIARSFRVENSFVASYSAFFLGGPSRMFLQALKSTLLLVTPYRAYQELTAGHVCWQIMDRKLAQQLFIRLEQRESELLLDDATTRYLKFRADYPGLEDRVKQQHIASYLGITPVTLSRIRSQLSRS